jgi:hypothetical protein
MINHNYRIKASAWICYIALATLATVANKDNDMTMAGQLHEKEHRKEYFMQ